MTRHVTVKIASTFRDNVETDSVTTLAKQVFDIVNGKTVVSISICKFGQNVAALVVYDDP